MIKSIFIILSLSIFAFSNLDTNSSKNIEYQLIINAPDYINKAKLLKNIGAKTKNMFNIWSDKNFISKDFINSIIPATKGYLENIGYFDSKVEKILRNNIIYLYINLGKPIKVIDIKIDSDINLNNIIDWKKGDIFSSDRFEQIKDRIRKKLLKNGYCNNKLNTKAYIDLKLHLAKLNYSISKNELCYFGKIYFEKYPKDIKKDVILSRLKFKSKEKFDLSKIEDSYNSINRLNTFANLQIKYNLDKDTKEVDTTISIDKKEKLRRYLVALGLDSEIGFRLKTLWEKRNFFGDAKRISVKTEVSKKTQDISSTVFIPAFLIINNRYLDFYITAGLYKDDNDGYKEKKAYINSYLNYQYKYWDIKTGIELDRLIINLKRTQESVIGGTFNILYPYISIAYDARDSKIDPKNGLFFKAYGEYGLTFRYEDVKYFKYMLEARAIKSFNDLTLSIVGKMGGIHEMSGQLPASKLFYGGGLFSNRAYSKDKIGVVNSNREFSVLGGKSFYNLQLEANYKIHKRFYGALFFDTTMINQKENSFSGKRIDTAGFGIRYKTPIGPIKIDIGFNIHNKKDYAISIMLGQSF